MFFLLTREVCFEVERFVSAEQSWNLPKVTWKVSSIILLTRVLMTPDQAGPCLEWPLRLRPWGCCHHLFSPTNPMVLPANVDVAITSLSVSLPRMSPGSSWTLVIFWETSICGEMVSQVSFLWYDLPFLLFNLVSASLLCCSCTLSTGTGSEELIFSPFSSHGTVEGWISSSTSLCLWCSRTG